MNLYADLIKNLNNPDITVYENYSTADFVSFKAGGAADVFVVPKTKNDLIFAVNEIKKSGCEFICVGNGTNLLVRDGGFRGAMICTSELKELDEKNGLVYAEAGAKLSKVTAFALSNNLLGMEFAGGIPGSVGGAVFMNAGAYGGEIKDIIFSAEVLFPDGSVKTLRADELGLSYRHSGIMSSGGIILSACFKLTKGDGEQGRKTLSELNARRKEKQPLDKPSAGSTFKRPEGYFAAALIEKAGLKGCKIGGAQVSEKHAGFVINDGGATAKDIELLTEEIKKRVYTESKVNLELEVRIIGENKPEQ